MTCTERGHGTTGAECKRLWVIMSRTFEGLDDNWGYIRTHANWATIKYRLYEKLAQTHDSVQREDSGTALGASDLHGAVAVLVPDGGYTMFSPEHIRILMGSAPPFFNLKHFQGPVSRHFALRSARHRNCS